MSLNDLIQSLATPKVYSQLKEYLSVNEVPEEDVLDCIIESIKAGNADITMTLIQLSAIPWNTLIEGKDFGALAKEYGHLEIYNKLVSEGVRSEFILTSLGHRFADEVKCNLTIDSC